MVFSPSCQGAAGLRVWLSLTALLLLWTPGAWATETPARLPRGKAEVFVLHGGDVRVLAITGMQPGEMYRFQVALRSGTLKNADRVTVALGKPSEAILTKDLNPGDPDLYFSFRPTNTDDLVLRLAASREAGELPLQVLWDRQAIGDVEQAAFEAEPNDDWRHANPLVIGRDVYGTADDVDYLDNRDEGKAGLDWFKLEVHEQEPILVYFQLDLLDRDVSANLRMYRVAEDGTLKPYENGKDPMEIVHDRERERYSKHISRTFDSGTYYLEVNANHPEYILRTRRFPVPPYRDPETAVEAGMHYVMNVGDAWFAQVPREGNISVRADNIHDTGTRCTACHASSFSTEANLVAHRNGYPIRSKSNFQYVMDRISNSVTPLYGNDGLYWQRFIAIPLQSQGSQGGILADFEREVSGRQTEAFTRFGPFLKAAWEGRKDLPADELNGVVPLDSKFGLAWRDWRVLNEVAERTKTEGYARAAANLARLVQEPAADKRVETLQDRIHRLYAWWLMNPEGNAARIAAETNALLGLQNEDGGWHELDSKTGGSAVYTTGQLVWTLLRMGHCRDEPKLAKALDYLLAQQQSFGGWFQTSTHENFRTPMRETRYAVEALAEAFPMSGIPRTSWGNRDEAPARLPRRDSLLHTLDDLENLWDVPEEDRETFAREIVPLLSDPEPLVRAAAAACLGRLGHPAAAGPLAKCLADPSKIVWRSAAWGLRRLGNAGVGLHAIRAALQSPDPATRRGAARIFAYQFHGMDTHLDIAYRLIDLTDDTDLWTRLQALKTLRQWFYRTNDANLQRRIVYAYLARMKVPDVPVVRQNLSEGMYIMLDENLGGGVSLQKNLAQLPEEMRGPILRARQAVERGVLLKPLLAALESGNALQREAVVRSFDGSFFKGRSFARRPEGMLDVGNDREFGFLYEPPEDVLDRAFAALFASETSPEARQQALRLASFFLVPERTSHAGILTAILRSLEAPDPGVRAAARQVVGDVLMLRGAETDPALRACVLEMLKGRSDEKGAVIRALSRNPALVARPETQEVLRGLLARSDAAALLRPVLSQPIFTDDEVAKLLMRGWEHANDPKERLALLDVLFDRRSMLDVEEPADAIQDLLRSAATDKSANVRERTLTVVSGLPALWKGSVSKRLILSALADDTPSLRALGIKLAAAKPGFWKTPDAREHLLRLLVDPDARCRDQALAQVEANALLVDSPDLARRVKALEGDPRLKARARAVLAVQGYDPDAVRADLALTRPKLLSLSAFREKVNPIFYQPSEDGYSCAKCHANHTILRIAEADPTKGLSGEQLMTNYSSVLKVINLGEPESSLVLRKPRSPQGQGGAEASSPTGLTHVGGPRWEGTDHPAYQALLSWIRTASSEAAQSPEALLRLSTDSYSPGYEPANAGDGDLATIWTTEFVGASPGYPHELTVDLGAVRHVNGLLYVPRQESSHGRVKRYEVRLSDDGNTWSEPAARGEWKDDPTFKFLGLGGERARFVQLRGLSEVNGRPVMSAAELSVDWSPAH